MIDGILLLDKPIGISSNHALQRVKRLVKAKKAGHTGCLDPLASGMLPICLGEATKFSRFFLESDKCYQFTLCLGATTTTGDAAGDLLSQQPVPPLSSALIEQIIFKFQGELSQIPPMYSAIKYQGKPLYQLAREGKEIERKARLITIHELNFISSLSSFEENRLTFIVKCSKGTYVRTLAEDIGKFLGCGAYVSALRRLWGNPFQTYSMIKLEELGYLDEKSLHASILPLNKILSQFFPKCSLSFAQTRDLFQGKIVALHEFYPPGWVMLVTSNEKFIGLGERLADGQLISRGLINQQLIDFA